MDESCRRRGVGSQLVSACEVEAQRWRAAGLAPADMSDVWLEVSLRNAAAVSFYESLAYVSEGETQGREVVRRRWSFGTEHVRRALMRKPLGLSTEKPNKPLAVWRSPR